MITPSNTQNYKTDYEKYVAKARILIHSDGVCDQIIKSLNGPDPVQRVADAGVMVAQRMDAATRAAGTEVQDAVKIYAGIDITADLSDLLEASTGTILNKDLKYLAFTICIQDYIKAEIHAGRINAQKVKVQMAASVRTLPPAVQKDIRAAQPKIQMIARKYNHGKGLASFPPDPPAKKTAPQEK